jgi:transcriptional regulator with XRE-family HTH domain
VSVTTARAIVVDPTRLRRRRQAAGMTIGDLAEAAGCARSYVGALESGQEPSCSAEIANLIEDALELAGIMQDLRGPLFRNARGSEVRQSKRNRRVSTPEQRAAMAADYRDGMTLAAVAEKHGWTPEGVRLMFTKDGVKIRPPWPQQLRERKQAQK